MKAIKIWLWTGVVMVLIQVLLGGITRLTGSGLSITEWDVLLGAVPPLNEQQWNDAFDKYKQFPQYKLVNEEMDLQGFKNIFWWEYVHRNWARLIGIVFIIPFIYFLIKKKLPEPLIKKLLLVFLLGALQGLIGWLMVASGLINKPWVNPYSLTLHLLLALAVFLYLIWLVLSIDKYNLAEDHPAAHKNSKWLIAIILVQIIFGGFMAGTKAGLLYNTYPLMNGKLIPPEMFSNTNILSSIFENQTTINFIHRTLALFVFIAVVTFYFVNKKYSSRIMSRLSNYLLIMIFVQFTLGVLTLLNAKNGIPVFLAAAHQLGAFILIALAFEILFYSKKRKPEII